jgi:outer membrane protein OmpA-like peptidoglycan-associated protein
VVARQAIGAAVKAETTAAVRREAREKRNEKTRQDADIRDAENKIMDAQGEAANIRAELARETRNRELAERDAQNYANQVRELRDELGRLREELGKNKVETEDVKAKLARIENERQDAERQQAESDQRARFQMNQGVLMQSLRKFGAVSQDERGIVLTLPENYWSGIRVSNFAPTAEPKLTSLGEVLASSAEYKITVEAHTDNKGTPEELESRIEAKGLGAALPVAPNSTNANRAKNRRVQIILVPSI